MSKRIITKIGSNDRQFVDPVHIDTTLTRVYGACIDCDNACAECIYAVIIADDNHFEGL